MNLCVLLLLASPPMHGSLPATLVAPFRRCDRHFVTFQHQGRPTKTMTFSGFPKEQNLRTDLFSNQKVGDRLQLCHPIFILGVPFCKVTKSFHPYIKRVPHSAHVDATGTLPFCEGRNLDIALVGVWYTFESCSQHKHTHGHSNQIQNADYRWTAKSIRQCYIVENLYETFCNKSCLEELIVSNK